MDETAITLPAELSPILDHSQMAGAPMSWVDGGAVPQPYGRLLVHDHDMTSELERFHGSPLTLEVLRFKHDGSVYLREVVLHAGGSGEPVEYGVIEILLDSFPAELRPLILGGEVPLGRILNDSGMRYHSEPQGFFHVPEADLGAVFPGSTGGANLYGRYNHLIRADGSRVLAKIIEILPSAG